MRRVLAVGAIVTAVAVAPAIRSARADGPDVPEHPDLVAEGEELARQGEYSRAIDKFKQADQLAPRAAHACLIGLVYTRRELWSQAEVFFARCRERATATDPVPDWLDEAERQLAAKLAEIAAAPVDLRVEPAGVAALLQVDTSPLDEAFAPRTVHLAAGRHTITATADGYDPTTEPIEIKSKDPVTITITLHKPGEVVGPGPGPDPRPVPRRKHRNVAKYLWIGAGGAAAIGIGFHLLAARERDQLAVALRDNDVARYDDHEGKFDTYRAITFAAYGAAVTAAAIGLVLHLTRERDDEGPALGGMVTPDGGFVTLGWTR